MDSGIYSTRTDLISLQVDKLIDLASAPPRGTGVQNIREIIIENKMTFDVSSDDWQVTQHSQLATCNLFANLTLLHRSSSRTRS